MEEGSSQLPKFLSDEDFNGDILRGLLAREKSLDVVRAQDSGLEETPDPEVLEWASQNHRVVLTHDAGTMIGFANRRVEAGLEMAGVVVVQQTLPIGQAIDELQYIALAGTAEDFANRIIRVPLRSSAIK